MAVVHIADTEPGRDLAGIMARVSAGDEIIINNGYLTVAMVPSVIPSRRSVSQCIALAKRHEVESGEIPVLLACGKLGGEVCFRSILCEI